MEDKLRDEAAPTTPVIVFNSLVRSVGTEAVRQAFVYSEEVVQNGGEGIAIEDEDTAAWSVAVDAEEVQFHFLGWGPYRLPLAVARVVLDTTEAITETIRENGD